MGEALGARPVSRALRVRGRSVPNRFHVPRFAPRTFDPLLGSRARVAFERNGVSVWQSKRIESPRRSRAG